MGPVPLAWFLFLLHSWHGPFSYPVPGDDIPVGVATSSIYISQKKFELEIWDCSVLLEKKSKLKNVFFSTQFKVGNLAWALEHIIAQEHLHIQMFSSQWSPEPIQSVVCKVLHYSSDESPKGLLSWSSWSNAHLTWGNFTEYPYCNSDYQRRRSWYEKIIYRKMYILIFSGN